MKMLKRGFSFDELAPYRIIVVPSGIGEFQWSWTKFHNVDEDFAILGLGGDPRRLHQFCELHDKIKVFGYVGFDYSQIRAWQKEHGLDTWAAVADRFKVGQLTMLACNPHLEAGRPLCDWLPDLPTTYTYPITLKARHYEEAKFLDQYPKDLLIGVSAASYRGSDAWNTWDVDQWKTFLQLIQRAIPESRFVLLGGSWDDLTTELYDPCCSKIRWAVDTLGLPPVGRTSFGGAVAVLEGLSGYIGFSSGLGHVAAHLCQVPVFMLWPEHEQLLSRSWVNPELLDTGTYVPSRWLDPYDVFHNAQPWLKLIQTRRIAA